MLARTWTSNQIWYYDKIRLSRVQSSYLLLRMRNCCLILVAMQMSNWRICLKLTSGCNHWFPTFHGLSVFTPCHDISIIACDQHTQKELLLTLPPKLLDSPGALPTARWGKHSNSFALCPWPAFHGWCQDTFAIIGGSLWAFRSGIGIAIRGWDQYSIGSECNFWWAGFWKDPDSNQRCPGSKSILTPCFDE